MRPIRGLVTLTLLALSALGASPAAGTVTQAR